MRKILDEEVGENLNHLIFWERRGRGIQQYDIWTTFPGRDSEERYHPPNTSHLNFKRRLT